MKRKNNVIKLEHLEFYLVVCLEAFFGKTMGITILLTD